MRTNFSIARKARVRNDIKEHKQRYAKQMLLERMERNTGKWIDHGYSVECPICNHQVDDEHYLGKAVACPNCGSLLSKE